MVGSRPLAQLLAYGPVCAADAPIATRPAPDFRGATSAIARPTGRSRSSLRHVAWHAIRRHRGAPRRLLKPNTCQSSLFAHRIGRNSRGRGRTTGTGKNSWPRGTKASDCVARSPSPATRRTAVVAHLWLRQGVLPRVTWEAFRDEARPLPFQKSCSLEKSVHG